MPLHIANQGTRRQRRYVGLHLIQMNGACSTCVEPTAPQPFKSLAVTQNCSKLTVEKLLESELLGVLRSDTTDISIAPLPRMLTDAV